MTLDVTNLIYVLCFDFIGVLYIFTGVGCGLIAIAMLPRGKFDNEAVAMTAIVMT